MIELLAAFLLGSSPPLEDGAKPKVPQPADVAPAVALEAGVRWLIDNQNEDGSWGSHHTARPIEVLADIPGSHDAFRVATTALCVMALRDCPDPGEDGFGAAERGLDYLIENYNVKRANAMEHYNVWSFGYTLQAFGEHLEANPEDPRARKIRDAAKHLLQKCDQYQTTDGGWGYLSLNGLATFKPSDTSMSFTTATVLVGLDRIRRAGVELPQQVVDKAVDHVKRSRLTDGAYLYGEYLKYIPRHGVNERKGSAARGPLCHLALELFGEEAAPENAFEQSIEDLLVRHADFQRVALRRPIPHESWYAISGYFYLYGHAYAAYLLERCSDEFQARMWPELIDAVLVCREPDGSFWDYPLYSYHKPYGTAFAVIALSRAVAHDAQ